MKESIVVAILLTSLVIGSCINRVEHTKIKKSIDDIDERLTRIEERLDK